MDFHKEVNLTEKEVKVLEDFEYITLRVNGLKNANGSFTYLVLEDYDHDIDSTDNFIRGYIQVGIQDGETNDVSTRNIIFDRKKLKVNLE